MITKFYDTCALLRLQDTAFSDHFIISSKTLNELESIKTSSTKDESIKYDARKLYHKLDGNSDLYSIHICDSNVSDILSINGLECSPDNLIIACAYIESKLHDLVFITDDIAARNIAEKIFGLSVYRESYSEDMYTGFVEIDAYDDRISDFYKSPDCNIFNCLINQYVAIKDVDGVVKDIKKWNGYSYIDIRKNGFKALPFGDPVRAKDVYQKMAIDSILSNQISIITGEAGSGKTFLSLACSKYLIDDGKQYNRVLILHNPTDARGAAKLGYYSGDAQDKLMQKSIGNILYSKFSSVSTSSDNESLDYMIASDKMKIMSIADCRGLSTRPSDILYITEAQNLSVDLARICITRAETGTKVILDGDFHSQVDNSLFEGMNNGLRKAIELFKGTDLCGYIDLQKVWRSRIAEIAAQM